MNKATQKQALTAGVRTALQTFEGFLVAVLALGGLLGNVTDIRTVPWMALGGALGAGVLIALLSGLRAYIGWVVNGIPATYTGQPASGAQPAAGDPVTPGVPANAG